MLIRALAAAVVLLTGLTLAAPTGATIATTSAIALKRLAEPEAAEMPTISEPTNGVVVHDVRPHLIVRYDEAERGWYRLTLTCQSTPEAYPLRWTADWLRTRQEWTATQRFIAPGGLPPHAICGAVVRRSSDRAETQRVEFEVVWGDGLLYMEPVPSTFWPAEADGRQRLNLVTHVQLPGDYEVTVRDKDSVIAFRRVLNDAEPGRYSFVWNGVRGNGRPAREGRYHAEASGANDPGEYPSEFVFSPLRRFSLHYGTETRTVRDRRGERDSTHVDLKAFTLSNGPSRVIVRYHFRTLRRPALAYLSAGLDADRTRRGYLVSSKRTRRGTLRPALWLAHLASDVGRPEKVRCRGLTFRVTGRDATFRIPRSCMTRGGRALRAYYLVYDKHGFHYDSGPDSRRSIWTPWVTYEVPPG